MALILDTVKQHLVVLYALPGDLNDSEHKLFVILKRDHLRPKHERAKVYYGAQETAHRDAVTVSLVSQINQLCSPSIVFFPDKNHTEGSNRRMSSQQFGNQECQQFGNQELRVMSAVTAWPRFFDEQHFNTWLERTLNGWVPWTRNVGDTEWRELNVDRQLVAVMDE